MTKISSILLFIFVVVLSGCSSEVETEPNIPITPPVEKLNPYEEAAIDYTLEILSKDANIQKLTQMRAYDYQLARGLAGNFNLTGEEVRNRISITDQVKHNLDDLYFNGQKKYIANFPGNLFVSTKPMEEKRKTDEHLVYLYPSFQLIEDPGRCSSYKVKVVKEDNNYKVETFNCYIKREYELADYYNTRDYHISKSGQIAAAFLDWKEVEVTGKTSYKPTNVKIYHKEG